MGVAHSAIAADRDRALLLALPASRTPGQAAGFWRVPTRWLLNLLRSIPELVWAALLLISAGFLAVCLLCIMKLRPWALRSEQARGEASGDAAMGGAGA